MFKFSQGGYLSWPFSSWSGKGYIWSCTLIGRGNLLKCTNAPRFMGPFQVLSQIGKLTNHLTLPDSASIYPVFHVSQLHIFVGHTMPLIPFPPKIGNNLMILANPIELLELRASPSNENMLGVLNWREGNPSTDATWEDIATMATQFLNFHLEDKVTLWRKGNDTDVNLSWKGI